MNNEQTEEESLLVTPEITNSRGDVRRNSTRKITARASLSPSNGEGEILSRYLRASVGSCHDVCKFGKKHTFESKGRHPTFPKLSGSGTFSDKRQNRVNVPSVVESQKNSAVKHKATAHSEISLYDRHKISEKKAVSPAVKAVKPIQESELITQHVISHQRSGSSEGPDIQCSFPTPSKEIVSPEELETIKQGGLEKIGICEYTETTAQKISAFPKKSEASGDSEPANKVKPSVKKIHLSLGPTSVENRSARKSFAFAKARITRETPSPLKKVISSGKPKVSKQDAPPVNRFDASARAATSRKSNVTFVTSESPRKLTTGISGRNTVGKRFKKVDLSKPGGKKILKSPGGSFSPELPVDHVLSSASPVKHAKKVQKAELENGDIREKTLYIIGPRTAENGNIESTQSMSSSNRPSPSSPSLSSSLSSSTSSPYISDFEEEGHQCSESALSETCDPVSDHGEERTYVTVQNKDKKSQRRVAMARQEYKDQTPYKLKFRRGKIVNPQSDNSGMRRLQFRHGRKMGDRQNGKGETEKISFRTKELTCGDVNHPDPEAQAVVLRHQDMQDKKDALGLFNHVIEETASKLVETRKSKVKALVGAFETVISLQDSKPATSI